MSSMGNAYIGTSGWSYKHWRGPFYPERLASKHWLDYYAQYFRSAEINNAFYRLPNASTLESWRETVPESFVFSVKASRYITHMKKLKDPAARVSTFLGRIDILGEKLGPILFQLPPNWHCNIERLQHFLAGLPAQRRYVLEPRDASWFDDAVYETLRDHGAAFCIYHLEGRLSPQPVTADFVYLRLHGPNGAYQGSYDTRTLGEWASKIEQWREQGLDVYCYFDNDECGYAARNAFDLWQRLS